MEWAKNWISQKLNESKIECSEFGMNKKWSEP